MRVDPSDAMLAQVMATPGASTREIAKRAGVSEWTADYHLRRLLKRGAVINDSSGRTCAWYATSCGLCPVLRSLTPALRRPETFAVALAVEETPTTLPRLAERADLPVGVTRWVARVLADTFVVERTRRGRIALREGGRTCIAQAAAGQRCSLWGKCHVSRAWAEERPSAAAGGAART